MSAPGPDKNKLRALRNIRGLMSGAEWRVQREEQQPRRAVGEFEVDRLVPGEVVGEPDDGFYLVRTDYPLEAVHGLARLGALLDARAEHIALSGCDEELHAFDPRTALFMDTETTGLAGGAGTVAFLVGVGYFAGDAFRLDQCFMRDYDDEEPMLAYLDGLFQRGETVVSYNGKSFDMPLLRTRFIQNRRPFRLDAALHFDLVHAARRLWRKRLHDCSLGNVERAVLEFRREGDVPSAEIPQIWLDYLHTRDATQLRRVFYHHQMDIVSLVALTALISERLDAPDGQGFEHALDRLAVIRLHERHKKHEAVVRQAHSLLEQDLSAGERCECLRYMANAYKRLRDFEAMQEALEGILAEHPRDLAVRRELAIYFEHRKRDLAAAETVCLEALEFLGARAARARGLPGDDAREADFHKRLERIRRKRSRAFPGRAAGQQEWDDHEEES